MYNITSYSLRWASMVIENIFIFHPVNSICFVPRQASFELATAVASNRGIFFYLPNRRMLRTYFYLTQALVCLASVAPTLSTLLEDNGDESSIDEITEFRIIKTENGLVRGKKELTLFDQRAYYSFKGIPYGRAPVGELRFKV